MAIATAKALIDLDGHIYVDTPYGYCLIAMAWQHGAWVHMVVCTPSRDQHIRCAINNKWEYYVE